MTDTTQALVEGTLDPMLGNDGLPWPHTFDGQTWAKEFIRHVKERPEIATDEGTMIGWFANAIMVGYDRAKQEPNKVVRGAEQSAGLRTSQPTGSDGRCPTCRQRNSHSGEREMDDGSVIVWHCNVTECSNHDDHPNPETDGRLARGGTNG